MRDIYIKKDDEGKEEGNVLKSRSVRLKVWHKRRRENENVLFAEEKNG